MTAPITDAELARLEFDVVNMCSFKHHEHVPGLISRLRAAERERDEAIVRAETAEAALEDAECRESSALSARDLTIRDLREQVKGLRETAPHIQKAIDACLHYFNRSCSRCDDGIIERECTCLDGPDVGQLCHWLDTARALLARTAPMEGT